MQTWNLKANNRDTVSPSSVEMLRIIDENLNAFFQLTIPMHSILLSDLKTGFDTCLQFYISKVKLGCGKCKVNLYRQFFLYSQDPGNLNVLHICRNTGYSVSSAASLNKVRCWIQIIQEQGKNTFVCEAGITSWIGHWK